MYHNWKWKKLSKNDAVNNILPGCGCSGIPWVPPDRALIVCWLRIPPGAPVWGTIEICREEPTREMSQSKPYILLTLSTSKSCKVSHWFTMLQLMSPLGILSTVLNTINYYIVFILITLCNSNLHVTPLHWNPMLSLLITSFFFQRHLVITQNQNNLKKGIHVQRI